jgi:hypothetical protein
MRAAWLKNGKFEIKNLTIDSSKYETAVEPLQNVEVGFLLDASVQHEAYL